MGRRPGAAVPHSRRRCCRRCETARQTSARRSRAFRRLDPHPWHRWRSAGRDHRARLLRAGHDEVHLRHGLLRAAEYRDDAGALAPSPADDDRLPARRQAHLCARRRDLRCGRGGAVAARWAPPRRSRVRGRRAGAKADRGRGRLFRPGVRRPRRAALGCRSPRRHPRPHAQHRPRRHRARGAGGGGLPDPRHARRDACRLARRGRDRASRRRRHDRERCHDAVFGRHSGRAGGSPR